MDKKLDKKLDKTLNPSEVTFVWECPECDKQVLWSYRALATAGIPLCSEHDIEMELISD